ncbi:hypothetical protein ACLOAU_14525 [Niabella sp. CJ426]|uniref:hypothetical protein n=1 Tax=Niabella sp. CJ426 TaxID=3393740 RepID=UPI003D034FB7
MKQLNFGSTNGVPNDPNKTVVHCPFEKGDKVYHIYYGWGVVQSISEEDNKDFPVLVDFDGQLEEFTKGGQFYFDVPPTLSFTEYTLQGFSQERPKPDIKEGQLIYVRFPEGSSLWHMAYFSHWDADRPACFKEQKKSGCTATWPEYSLTNPLEEK